MSDTIKNKKNKILILLDTHALIHRAFHALPPLTSPTGEPVGAVYGVANIFLKILKEFQPDYIAAAFDRSEPTFRHEAYKDYKAQRAEAPDDLIAQFNTVRELFQAFGVQIYDKAGYEADDIIGTLSRQARDANSALKIIIASGDLDTMQLVDGDRTVVFTMRKGVADTVLYDENAMRERFGFGPLLLPDFKGLKGDPSDNIKGVPGVGDKTATILIQRFGVLEELYTELSKKDRDTTILKGKLPDILLHHKDDAFFSRDLARIRQDVPIAFTLSDTVWSGVSAEGGADTFLERVGFTSLRNRLSVAKQGITKPTAVETSSKKTTNKSLFQENTLPDTFFSDTHTANTMYWLLLQSGSFIVSVGDETWFITREDVARHKKQFSDIFENIKKHIAFGGKELLKFFWHAGCKTARIDFDIGIAAWVLNPSLRDPDIQELIQDKTRKRVSDEKDIVVSLPALTDVLRKELQTSSLEKIYFDIELPLIPVLARMECAGITLDIRTISQFSRKLTKTLHTREQNIYKLAGVTFNISSPKQLGEVLFEKLGISSETVRKTDGGVRSTRASELIKLRGLHPVIDEILAWREEMKLKTTYVDTLPLLIDPKTGKIHSTFNQTGTVTGRLSSLNPNMQNIPTRTPLGQEIRRAFVASPGYTFLSCDYSQIELRLAAHLSGDERMIEVFQSHGDVHTLTASAVNHVSLQDVTPVMRRAAKAINFGILYGMGAQSLAESLQIPRREADSFIKSYFLEFPRIREFMDHLKKMAHEKGYVETLFGRRRYFHNIENLGWQARREAERMAINAPIQGSDSDIVKIAMVRMYKELSTEMDKDRLRLILQVHDELLFEVDNRDIIRLRQQIQRIMERVCKLSVPLKVDVREGTNWRDIA